MRSPLGRIAARASALASQVPGEVLEVAAGAFLDAPDFDAARSAVAQCVAHTPYRRLIGGFLKPDADSGALPPSVYAAMLISAAASEREHRARLNVEVVWTGPESEAVSVRQTEQVILQVIDSATKRITLVSYAVYEIPRIREALVRAAARGVHIDVIIETPDKVSGQKEYSTLRAMGADVAGCSRVYYWPLEQRSTVGAKVGILHVKCVAADSRWLFISSANLTEYAFAINMELGTLITGGEAAQSVEKLFDGLIARGVLSAV